MVARPQSRTDNTPDAQLLAIPYKEPKEVSGALSLYLPEEYKAADINTARGIITAYMTVYNDQTGAPFVDSYLDIIEPGSFTKTIQELDLSRKNKNNPYLCADLWQHDRKELIGGIIGLTEDSKGVIYEAQLAMGVQRAREAFELVKQRMLGSSFGYDAIRFEYKGDIRHLLEIRLHEISQVTFPANPHAPILDTKDDKKFYVPTLPTFPTLPDEDQYNLEKTQEEENILFIKAVCGNTGMPIGPRDQSWDASAARNQYKNWGTDSDGKIIPSKYKQVHLRVNGDPTLGGSYGYPFANIVSGSPQMNVGGVIAASNAIQGARGADAGGDTSGIRSKLNTMRSRINAKYPDDPELEPLKADARYFDWKQDFQSAWSDMLPGQLISQFFRMSDVLTYTLLDNFNDDDIDPGDQEGLLDDCLNQFSDAAKAWLQQYTDATANGSSEEEQETTPAMGVSPFGLFETDIADMQLKRATHWIKAGATISDATRKRIQAAIDSIINQCDDLSKMIGANQEQTSSTPYTYDITQGLSVLNTLAPTSENGTPSVPSTNKPTAPMFPSLPDDRQYNITDLLANIRQTMTGT